MAGPLGVLLVGPAVATTEVEKDVDGGPPRRRCRQVQQRPPPKLKETSMEGCLGGAASRSGRGPWNAELVKWDPLSVVILFGTPNLQMMDLTIDCLLILTTGVASHDLVNLLMAT
jgi:hypothetical protein